MSMGWEDDSSPRCYADGRLFDPRLLDRALMSTEAAVTFRDQATRCLRYDQETGAVVVCYLHPDGRVLIDEVRLP